MIGLNVSQCLNEVCNGCADAHRCSLYGINAQGMISGLSLSKSNEYRNKLNQLVERSTRATRALFFFCNYCNSKGAKVRSRFDNQSKLLA